MSNTPPSLEADELAILQAIDDTFGVRGIRLSKTPLRDRMKRRGLIHSEPPNLNILLRAISGKAHCWKMTALGREAFEYAKENARHG
jgi:hypothetical protein